MSLPLFLFIAITACAIAALTADHILTKGTQP
jgi:cell division protein FtsL